MSKDKETPAFVASLDTQLIAERLRKAKVGETVTYDELDQLIGRSSRQHGLRSALNELVRERVIFDAVPSVGYKRLASHEIVGVGRTRIKRINRAAKRNIKILAATNYEELTQEQKLQHNTVMTVSALAAASTGADSVKRVEGKVKDANAALPAGKAAIAAIGNIDSLKAN